MSDLNRIELRNQMLANGFEPLPLEGKACYVPGWSHCTIDQAFLDGFRRNGRFTNTGVRCGNVVGVDIDCDDPDLADIVDDCITSALGETLWCRWGRGSRRLLVYWTDTPIAKLRTGRYGGQQVEVLGKGCQFAAYGIHPTTGQAYMWGGETEADAKHPAVAPVEELPAVTDVQLRDLVDRLEALLAGTGRPLESPGGDLGETPQHDYCLTPDMVFETRDRGPMSVAQLREEGYEGVCNLTALRPTSDSWGGMVRRTHDGGVCIADFVTGLTYFEAQSDAVGADDAGGMAALTRALAQAPPGGMFSLPVPTPLADLLANYCYVATDDSVRRLDAPSFGIRRVNFSNLHRSYVQTGPNSKQLLVNYWLENGALRCTRAALLPDRVERLVPMDGGMVLNTYVAPVWPAEGGGTGMFHDFVEGLIPDPGERELLLDWMAWKVQHPDARMHCLVLVAQSMGTGRGTLMKILERLVGGAYTTHTTLAHVFGRTYQSQYNDWLADSLLITVPEAADTLEGHSHDWQARRRAYEALKEVVETASGRQMVRRKGAANSSAALYCSIVVSTNHVDALAVEEGDRRLLVLSGGVVRSPMFYVQLHAWLGVDSNIGALSRELSQRKVAYDPYGPPPMTAGKARMIDAGDSDLDYAWKMFKAEAPGDLCTVAQFKAYVERIRVEAELSLPDNYAKLIPYIVTQKAVRLNPNDTKWQLRIGTARVRPWVIRNGEKWSVTPSEMDLDLCAAEILKNGPPGGGIARIDGKPWKDD